MSLPLTQLQNNHICSSCENLYNKAQRDKILINIKQFVNQSIIENLCLDCIQENFHKECGASYIKIKELQKVHEQAKLSYQLAYDAWKASIADYERIDHSLALIKHLIAQENKPKPVRKSTKKQLSEQEIVETMLGSLTEEQREALSKIIQSGVVK